ncbi:MAG TPA: hypothetical protein VFV60_05530, partial [bacterium]|nr:hypothetical protein [bacterium]
VTRVGDRIIAESGVGLPHLARDAATDGLSGLEFAAAFDDCDELVITELYSADEVPIPGVGASLIVDAVRAHRSVTFISDAHRLVDHLLPSLRAGDVVLTLGAGDISAVADDLVAALQARHGVPAPTNRSASARQPEA